MTLGSSWRTSCGPYLRTYLYLLILTGDNVTRLELEDELWALLTYLLILTYTYRR